MKHIKWKTLIITGVIALLPILIGIFLWDKLPGQIAIHFNLNNEPDGFASKGFAVFALPGILLLLQVLFCIGCDLGINKKKYIPIMKWIIPITSIVVNPATYAYAMGVAVDMRWVAGILAVCIIAIVIAGNEKLKKM